MKNIVKFAFLTFPLLTSCMPSLDMQGNDPREYYAAHPIENKVEGRHFVARVQFDGKSNSLSGEKLEKLKSDLRVVNSQAAESISLQISPVMQDKKARVEYMKRVLRSLGYSVQMPFHTDGAVLHNEMVIDIAYSVAVAPDCPDWRQSPVVNYSNSLPANYGCAAAVNLGAMVDNPKDLVMGQGTEQSNTERSSKVLTDYKSGVAVEAAVAPTSATGQ